MHVHSFELMRVTHVLGCWSVRGVADHFFLRLYDSKVLESFLLCRCEFELRRLVSFNTNPACFVWRKTTVHSAKHFLLSFQLFALWFSVSTAVSRLPFERELIDRELGGFLNKVRISCLILPVRVVVCVLAWYHVLFLRTVSRVGPSSMFSFTRI